MTNLLEIREQLKVFYSKYEVYVTPAVKFLGALVTLILINSSLGYMTELNNVAVVLILALMCSFMPNNFIVVLATAVTLGHLYRYSLECAIVALVVFLLLYILYFRFSATDTLTVLITPLCFVMNIPYVMPLAVGLTGTPASAVAVACGTVVYHMIHFMNENAATLANSDTADVLVRLRFVVDGILDNKTMLITVIAFIITTIVVYIIRRLSIDYSWMIATVAGALLDIVILLFGTLIYSMDISIVWLLVGSILSVLIVEVLQFFLFNVDYTRTENVQFEDDEYYYYVKAVPKNTVPKSRKRVKTIRVPDKAVYGDDREDE